MIGDVQLPTSARMNLYRQENIELQPLEYYNVVDAPQNKSGMLFMHALFVNSKNLNFLEGLESPHASEMFPFQIDGPPSRTHLGCYHMYTPHDASFPGIILSTGTEVGEQEEIVKDHRRTITRARLVHIIIIIIINL